ncbi:G-protein coupled receptor moody-like [Amphiura filiformis]|uniref:G-protein coupled receptor moody-like n=1 Tax=Amphiura filiformis TaxID=82378 RepID=UPI003B218B61
MTSANLTTTMIIDSTELQTPSYTPSYIGLMASAVYMTFLTIVGGLGNILVIVAILISPRLKNRSYAFTFNLSIADLGVNLIVIPLGLVSLFNYGWPPDPIACRTIFYLYTITISVSLQTLTMVALNRYLLITKPRQTFVKFCGLKQIVATLFALWMTAILLSIIPELGFGAFHYDPYLRICYVDNSDPAAWWHMNGIIIFGFVAFFSTIPILYFLTFRAVRASKLRVHAQSEQTNNHPSAQNANCTDGDDAYRQRASIKKRKTFKISKDEIRLTQITALIFLILTICWSPLLLVHFFKRHFDVPVAIQRLAVLLVYTNSSFNPYLYALMNKNFRQAYKKILSCGRSQIIMTDATIVTLNVVNES